jgi:hypothetical protein
LNKGILVVEIFGENSQKIAHNLERQEWGLEWILEHKNLGSKDLDMDINNQIYIKALNGRLLNRLRKSFRSGK